MTTNQKLLILMIFNNHIETTGVFILFKGVYDIIILNISMETEIKNDNFRYVVLMETNEKHFESWYYFIRYEGNEKELHHLQSELEKVRWYPLDNMSTFYLDLTHFVSSTTAKEMIKLKLNKYFHRKFDGKLKHINFNFNKRDRKSDRRMIYKVFEKIGDSRIDEYISDEDCDGDVDDSSATDDDDSITDDENDDSITDDDDDIVYDLTKSSMLIENIPPKSII